MSAFKAHLSPASSPPCDVPTLEDGFVDFDTKFDRTRLLVKIPQVSFLNDTLVPISQILNLGENTKSHKESQKVFSIIALSSLFCSQFLFFNCLIGIFLVKPLRLYIHLRTHVFFFSTHKPIRSLGQILYSLHEKPCVDYWRKFKSPTTSVHLRLTDS